jgi:hypothetical protein
LGTETRRRQHRAVKFQYGDCRLTVMPGKIVCKVRGGVHPVNCGKSVGDNFYPVPKRQARVFVADSFAPYEANKDRLSPITTVSASARRSYCWSSSLPCLSKIYAGRSPQLRQHKDLAKAE